MKINKINKIKRTNEGYLKVTLKLTAIGDQKPYFSATYELNKNPKFTDGGFISGGCNHELIAKYFPELEKFLKWHLCSVDGPMHYFANSLYHASSKDCHGLEKGEKRQIFNGRTGEPVWRLAAVNKETGEEISLYRIDSYKDGLIKPICNYSLEYRPSYRIGEGKTPDLEAARSSAIWPDANLEDFTEEKLAERLPRLLSEFKKDMEELGFL